MVLSFNGAGRRPSMTNPLRTGSVEKLEIHLQATGHSLIIRTVKFVQIQALTLAWLVHLLQTGHAKYLSLEMLKSEQKEFAREGSKGLNNMVCFLFWFFKNFVMFEFTDSHVLIAEVIWKIRSGDGAGLGLISISGSCWASILSWSPCKTSGERNLHGSIHLPND